LQFKGLYNMPIRVTTVSTRPNTNVAFWSFDAETRAHLKAEFKDTGKLLSKTTETSADGLTRTVVRTFANKAALDEYKADPARAGAVESRDAYNTSNGTTTTTTVVTV
jgi:hypothetical protein